MKKNNNIATKVDIERLEGRFTALETIVKMNMAEQKAYNQKLDHVIEKIDERIALYRQEFGRRIEKNNEQIEKLSAKVNWFSGIIAAIVFVIEVVKGFILGNK